MGRAADSLGAERNPPTFVSDGILGFRSRSRRGRPTRRSRLEAELGYRVETLSDLTHQGKTWKSAPSVFLPLAPLRSTNPDIEQEIVRCLSVPWLGNKGTAA